MKSSKEIADTVFKIRDEYLEKKRKRNLIIKTITSCCSAACLCAIVLVCAKNMQLPDVDDWIAPSSEPSDFETSEDGTTIKVVTSDELQATVTTPQASVSTDVREQNTENTATTVRSGDDGNNTNTTKSPGGQNTVTTSKPAGSGVNNTKTTKRTGSQNTVTTRRPAGSGVNNTKTTKRTGSQNNVTTRKPAASSVNHTKTTYDDGMQPNKSTTRKATTQIHTNLESVTAVTTVPVTNATTLMNVTTVTEVFVTNVVPNTTIQEVIATTAIVTTEQLVTSIPGMHETTPPPLSGETQLVIRFSEIYYNGNSYKTDSDELSYSNSIDSYIGEITLWDDNNYAIIADVYKINDVPVDDAVAIKFRGYNTYFYYRRRW